PGALSRYYLTLLAAQWFGAAFPYGTFFINLTGAGLIGFLSTLIAKQAGSTDLQALLLVGFLGSYTTFSTYALDTSNLLRTGSRKRALFYWLGSPILGFLGVELGIFLAQQVP
ncbi:MAG: fluoride efflux transporter CrcB, partial [Kovacikia sp.]